MYDSLKLLLAEIQDAPRCYEILDSGRKFQREQGFIQWPDNYPLPEDVEEDIQNGSAYKILLKGIIVGYMCISFDGEPTYEYIEGAWKKDVPYAVVHRIAFAPEVRGKRTGDKVIPLIEQVVREKGFSSIRLDTDFPNLRMQHMVERNGFEKCGIIYVRNHEGRIAYEKDLA